MVTSGVGVFLGRAVAQLFGNALFEELLFRGVLLRQCLVWLLAAGLARKHAILFAVVASQAIFAAAHLPLRLHEGVAGWPLLVEMCSLFCLGSLLAATYLATRNLALIVVVHALSNAPSYVLAERIDFETSGMIAAVVCVALIAVVGLASLAHTVKRNEGLE